MNIKGMFIGWVIFAVVTIAALVAIQLLVWGYYAPDWYAAVVAPCSMIAGVAGAYVGDKKF